MSRSSNVVTSLVMATIACGCEQKMDVIPPSATSESYQSQIDYEGMPAETQVLYEALLNGELSGAHAANYQPMLDTAQRLTEQETILVYEFQLTEMDRPYEEVFEEGVPFMFVVVQKRYGHIYHCDVSAPCF